jgi:manganese transport protein
MNIASGLTLGEIIARRSDGKGGWRLRWGLFLAVAFGCAAYQAGNLIGAVSGLQLLGPISRPLATLMLGFLAAAALLINNFRLLARILSGMVAIMGMAFIYVAVQVPASWQEWVHHAAWPSFPSGSGLLIIGLVGTTIVPYNLFLGSGMGQGQSIREMRLGIVLAVGVGGIISIAIMAAGLLVSGPYSYEALSAALSQHLGAGANVLFGLGLFAAGFSSAITAPLAAAVTAHGLLGASWESGSLRFRMVWAAVLLFGLAFGVFNIKPVPAIVLAQAVNGVLLPLATIALLLAANDRALLGEYANGRWVNALTLIIVGITCFLGLNNLWRAISQSFGLETGAAFPILAILSGLVMFGLGWKISRI